jgi:hypothetical protein
MGETLTQRCRVDDEGFRVVKSCREGRNRKLTVPHKKAQANSVPAAAVIRSVQALFGITGRKARVGGLVSRV